MAEVIKGRQGVWLVDFLWDDGRKATLPTAHNRFFNSATKRYEHNNTGMLKYRQVEGLERHRQARCCRDDRRRLDRGYSKRTGYSDVFAVTDLQLEDHGSNHSFTVTRWL